MSKVQSLRSVPIFRGLSDKEIEALAEIAFQKAYPAGEYIFWEGDPAERFYIVEEGRVKIIKQLSIGKEFIIAFFAEGEIFGEVAVFQGKPYPASAQADIPSRVLAINSRDFLGFITRNPDVALRIIGILGQRLREAQARLRDLAGERAEQRIYAILAMLSAKFGAALPFTRKEVADMAGTTTETAIRVLGRLTDGKIIGSSRGEIKILDPQKLRLLSEGPPPID